MWTGALNDRFECQTHLWRSPNTPDTPVFAASSLDSGAQERASLGSEFARPVPVCPNGSMWGLPQWSRPPSQNFNCSPWTWSLPLHTRLSGTAAAAQHQLLAVVVVAQLHRFDGFRVNAILICARFGKRPSFTSPHDLAHCLVWLSRICLALLRRGLGILVMAAFESAILVSSCPFFLSSVGLQSLAGWSRLHASNTWPVFSPLSSAHLHGPIGPAQPASLAVHRKRQKHGWRSFSRGSLLVVLTRLLPTTPSPYRLRQ